MKSTVEPITDAELAEVKRLHAAAYVVEPWTVEVEEYGNSGMVTITGLERILHDTDWADPEDFGVDQDRAHWIAGITNSFRPIIARLEAVEREQQRVHELANRLLDANNGLIDTIRNLDKEELCDWHDGIGGDEYLQQWLTTHDAKQRREGAAQVWDQIASIGRQVTDQFIHITAQYAEEQAKRLREGGE